MAVSRRSCDTTRRNNVEPVASLARLRALPAGARSVWKGDGVVLERVDAIATESLARFEDRDLAGAGYLAALADAWAGLPGLTLDPARTTLGDPYWTRLPARHLRELTVGLVGDAGDPLTLTCQVPWYVGAGAAPPDLQAVLGAHRGVVDGRARYVSIGGLRAPGLHLVAVPRAQPTVALDVVPLTAPSWRIQLSTGTDSPNPLTVSSDFWSLAHTEAPVIEQLDRAGTIPRVGAALLARGFERLGHRRPGRADQLEEADLEAIVEILREQTRALGGWRAGTTLPDPIRPPLHASQWVLGHLGDHLTCAVHTGAVRGMLALRRAAREGRTADRTRLLAAHLQRELRDLGTGRGHWAPMVKTAHTGNAVAQVDALSAVSFIGPRGLPDLGQRIDLRVLDASWQGTLCPVHTPENTKIGLVRHLARGATSGPVAEAEPLLDDYRDLSPAASLTPLVGHDDPTRIAIVTKMFGQALTMHGSQVPSVRTGMEAVLAEDSGVARAPVSGVVEAADGLLAVREASGRRLVPFGQSADSVASQARSWTVLVQPGDFVTRGQLLAHAPEVALHEGVPHLALGVDALAAFVPWDGWNYEDGVVVSESLSERMASDHRVTISIDLGPRILDAGVRLVESPDLPAGASVRQGDELATLVEGGRVTPVRAAEDGRLVVSTGPGYRHLSLDGTELSYRLDVRRPLTVGDKVTTRHGGKGVVLRVLPDNDMPRLSMPGGERVVDVLLNPLGVLRRLNIGTLLEANVGLEALLRGEAGGVTVPRRLSSEGRRSLSARLAALGAPGGRLPLVRPDGAPTPPAGVVAGPVHLMKLHHQAVVKAGARADAGPSPNTLQPARRATMTPAGRRGAPQRFGEMEVWAALAAGADGLVADLLHSRGVGQEALRGSDSLPAGTRAAAALLAVTGRDLRATLTPDAASRRGVEDVSICRTPDLRPSECRSLVVRTETQWSGLPDVVEHFADAVPDVLARAGQRAAGDGGEVNETRRARAVLSLVQEEPLGAADAAAVRYAVTLPFPVRSPSHGPQVSVSRVPVLPKLMLSQPRTPGAPGHDDVSRYVVLLSHAISGSATAPGQLPAGDATVSESPPDPVADALAKALEGLVGRPDHLPRDQTVTGRLRGKYGVLRRNLLGAAAVRSARAVLSGDPTQDIETVVLPDWLLEALGVGTSPEDAEHDDVVVLNRQPSLHPYSLVALRARPGPHPAAVVHPYILQAIAGDFDGDTVALHRPEDPAARRQAWALLRPRSAQRNAGSGASMAKQDLDIALGLWLLADDPSTRDAVAELLGTDVVGLVAPAGRRAALDLAIDAALDPGSHAPTETLATARSLMEAGWAGASQWSAGVLELPRIDVGDGDAEARVDAHLRDVAGSPEDHNPDENALASAYLSGSAGKAVDLAQLLVTRGDATPLSAVLEPTRIDACYLDGIPAEDYFAAAQPAISGLAAKKLVTPFAGALTRALVNASADEVIGGADCGSSSGHRTALDCLDDQCCQHCYGPTPGTGASPRPGSRVGLLAAMLVGEQSTQAAMKAIHQRGGGTDLSRVVRELGALLSLDSVGKGRSRVSGLQRLQDAYAVSAGGRPTELSDILAPVEAAVRERLPRIHPVHVHVLLRTQVSAYERFRSSPAFSADLPFRDLLAQWRRFSPGSPLARSILAGELPAAGDTSEGANHLNALALGQGMPLGVSPR